MLDSVNRVYYFYYMRRSERVKTQTGGLPAVTTGPVGMVCLSDAFCEVARAAGIPKEMLASYVCEEWGEKYAGAEGILLKILASPSNSARA